MSTKTVSLYCFCFFSLTVSLYLFCVHLIKKKNKIPQKQQCVVNNIKMSTAVTAITATVTVITIKNKINNDNSNSNNN